MYVCKCKEVCLSFILKLDVFTIRSYFVLDGNYKKKKKNFVNFLRFSSGDNEG